MAPPLVTVGLPTFNRKKYLAEAIESVRAQSFEDFELIVSDNASDIDIEPVVNSFNDARIRFIRRSSNLGAVRNMNGILRDAAGKYVILHHDDDVMEPKNLELKAAMLEENPNVGFVHSNWLQIDADGKAIGECLNAGINKPGIESGREFVRRMLKRNVVGCPTVMIRRKVFDDVGLFYESIRHTSDISMWIKIGLFHDVGYLADPLIKLRKHAGQDSTQHLHGYREAEQIYTATMAPLIDFQDRAPELAGLRSEFQRDYLESLMEQAAEMSRTGNLKTVAGYLGFGASKNPLALLRPRTWAIAARAAAKSFLNRSGIGRAASDG